MMKRIHPLYGGAALWWLTAFCVSLSLLLPNEFPYRGQDVLYAGSSCIVQHYCTAKTTNVRSRYPLFLQKDQYTNNTHMTLLPETPAGLSHPPCWNMAALQCQQTGQMQPFQHLPPAQPACQGLPPGDLDKHASVESTLYICVSEKSLRKDRKGNIMHVYLIICEKIYNQHIFTSLMYTV